MAPTVEMIGKVTRSRYHGLVADSLDLVEEDTRCRQSQEPAGGHGLRQPGRHLQ